MVDWQYLAEKIGKVIAGDFADKITEAATEVNGYTSEALEFAEKLRDIEPFVNPKRCVECGAIARPGHQCDPDVVNTTASEPPGPATEAIDVDSND